MVSELDRAKRALVTLIKSLAALYSVVVEVVRDSDDAVIRGAFRKVSRKVHPDRGGNEADQKRLNEAYESWCKAVREKGSRGRPKKGGPADRNAGGVPVTTLAAPAEEALKQHNDQRRSLFC